MQIIPAIDIIDGKCVRLSQGEFARQSVYADSPLTAARKFEAAGMQRLHVVDLDGAKTGNPCNLGVLASIAANTRLKIDFGGGVKSYADVQRVFDAGAEIVTIGSIAVKEPFTFFEWLTEFGEERFLLGADVRHGKLSIDGWQTDTEIELLRFLTEYHEHGVSQAFVTDISKDGELQGPAFSLYRSIRQGVPNLELIASGGVSSVDDIEKLRHLGCSGVIIGKAIYEGRIGLKELTRYVG